MKKLSYILVFSTAFYLGNIAPVKLPEPKDVIKKIEGFVNKLSRQNKTIRQELKKELTQKVEKEFFITPFEKKMIELVNQQRELNNVPKLKFSKEELFEMARQHSGEMKTLGYFSHESPVEEYRTLKDRLHLAGETNYSRAGENIAFISCCGECDQRNVEASMFGGVLEKIEMVNDGVEISATPFMQNNCLIGEKEKGLMFSPGHRKNILNPEFEYIGVGIVTGEGKYLDYEGIGMWVTQNFATYKHGKSPEGESSKAKN